MAQDKVNTDRIFSMFNVNGQFKRPMQVFSFDTMFEPMPGKGKTPGKELEALKYCVKSIKLPELKIEPIDDMHFGGFKLSLPTYNIAERTLKIDFEEDSKMTVTKAFLTNLQASSDTPTNLLSSNGEWKITIAIYNEYTPEKEPEIKEYAASLLSMSTPELNRNGSVGACSISTEWYVKPFNPNALEIIAEDQAETKAPKQAQKPFTDPLDGILTGNSRAEYYEYLAKLRKKDKNFNPDKSAYIYYDMATNTKYAIKDGKIVRTYAAFTATGAADYENGEAPEGAYKMFDINVNSTAIYASKHSAKKQTTERLIAEKGLKVDDLEKEVASGKYKSMKEAMNAHGIKTKGAQYTYYNAKEKQNVTKTMGDTDFGYSSYSKYSSNLIDEGNGDTYREDQNRSGINSHINSKENTKEFKAYEAKRAAGTNTAEDDFKIRQNLRNQDATWGCSVMSSEDTAWEKQFMNESGGTIYEIKGNGTSDFNKRNDKKHTEPPEIGYSRK